VRFVRGHEGTSDDRVRLVLFGTPRILRAEAPVTFDTRKATALLARVAEAGRPVTRDALAALLWPDADDERARAALRRTLSVAGAIGPALVVDRSSVALDEALTEVDTREFERRADSEDPAGWRIAVDLARDRFLDGFALRDAPDFDDWQTTTAEAHAQRLSRVLDRLVGSAVADGDLDQALADARRRLDLDPLHEPAHQSVIRLMAWTGDRSGAMTQFRACARILDEELGVRPLPETHALYDQIRDEGLAPPVVGARQRQVEVTAPRAAPRLAPDRLVGRDPLLAALADHLDAVARAGRVVALVGEPGIGRSALADAFAEQSLASGVGVLVGRAHEAERGLALAAVGDLVRQAMEASPASVARLRRVETAELSRLVPLDDVPPLPALDGPGAQTRLFDAVSALLRLTLTGDGTRGLLVVDDADHLDAASADFVGYLARRVPPGLLVVLTWRLSTAPDALSSTAVERVAVPPLGPDDAATLVRSLGLELDGSEVAALVRRTGGSPRLLREYALTASAGDPVRSLEIRDLVDARLAASAETTRQVVAAAAVLGRAADPDLLRITSGRADVEVVDAVEEAVERGLLVELRESGEYDIPYDGLRVLVESRLSQARRRLLHGRAADALLAQGEAPAAGVAAHLAAAGRRDEAAGWYWTAACEARDLWAHETALDNLAEALALGFDPERCHRACGDALTALGRYRAALDELEQAASLCEGRELADVEHSLADIHHRLGAWSTSRSHLESALALLEPFDDDEARVLRARCLADLALLHVREHELELAAEVTAAAFDLATRTGDAAALAQSLDVLGVLAAERGDLVTARTHLRASLSYAAHLDDPAQTVAALNNLSLVELEDGNLPEALDVARRALELGERHGDRHRLAALHTNLADLLHAADRPDEALAHLAAAAALFADVDSDVERRPEIWKLVAW
jgi:DNA-binding SARP family transcriptional activator/tetratricopeptide (TPR) repeat protein